MLVLILTAFVCHCITDFFNVLLLGLSLQLLNYVHYLIILKLFISCPNHTTIHTYMYNRVIVAIYILFCLEVFSILFSTINSATLLTSVTCILFILLKIFITEICFRSFPNAR